MKKTFQLLFIFFLGILFSCETNREIVLPLEDLQTPSKTPAIAEEKQLTLVFAGDVMAHKAIYEKKNFDKIWEDISGYVLDSDFAFANIEAPVNNDVEWSSFPRFNMHTDYIQAAINSGFNVFSLANNHTNDWYLNGIQSTKNIFENLEKNTASSERKIYACGLKDKKNGSLSYRVLEKDGWKILFVSVTEILNNMEAKEYVDYYPANENNHKYLISEMKRLKKENECSVSVISVHTNEPEYIRTVTESHKKFFRDLILKADVDVVWANHPHIVKKYEVVKNSQGIDSLIMYANGNTIAGQRTNPQWDKPSTPRDNTGDGVIFKVTIRGKKNLQENDSNVVVRESMEIDSPYIVTTYIDPNGIFVIRHLDENFIQSFRRLNYKKKADYFAERFKITQNALE